MSKYFIYQPHIHETDAVATPDLAVENLAATSNIGHQQTFRSVPVSRLSSNYEIQLTDTDWVVRAAYLLVASGNGTILAPALDILPAEADGRGEIAAGEKSVGRQAWRLPDLDGGLSGLTFRLSAFKGTETTFREEAPAASMIEPDALISAYCKDHDKLPRAAAVIDVPGTTRSGELPRSAAIMSRSLDAHKLEDGIDRLVLELKDPRRGRAIDHTVTLDRLP